MVFLIFEVDVYYDLFSLNSTPLIDEILFLHYNKVKIITLYYIIVYDLLAKMRKKEVVFMELHVSQDATSSYKSISDALLAIPDNYKDPISIYVHKGVYHEKVTLPYSYLTIQGDGVMDTIITYDHCANMQMEDGSKRGTFRTPTLFVDANFVTIRNLTIENHAGLGHLVGQALAAYVDGDFITFENCRLLGNQDTLFTGPLPPAPYEPGGFVGPKEHSPRLNGRHLYSHCYIEGDIDFIFGSATALFDHCEIFSKNIGKPCNGYVTASSTPQGQQFGYVFYQCDFTSNCPPNTVYLGRPWRDYGQVVLLECNLGPHIKEEGWHDWGKEHAHSLVYFAEYNSKGDGSNPNKRVPWSKQLSKKEALTYLEALREFYKLY